MTGSGKRWTVQDRTGNPIYLTAERWRHIIEANNHLEVADYEDSFVFNVPTSRGPERMPTLR